MEVTQAVKRGKEQVYRGTNGDEPSCKLKMLFKLDNGSGPSSLTMPPHRQCSASSSSSVTHVEEYNPGSDDTTEQALLAKCPGEEYWLTAGTPIADETPFREPLVFGKNSARNIEDQQQTISSTVVPLVPTFPFQYRSDDPWGAKMIQGRVNIVLERWGSLNAIDPTEFFHKLLSSRGYSTDVILAPATRRAPTPRQMSDYTPELVNAVRRGDVVKVRELWQAGYSMSACNSYSESLLHIACRRASFDVVLFVLQHGGDPSIVDDFGRTPLHDACWRTSQRFDIVTMLVDYNRDFLRQADIRGSTPLSYVQKAHWLEWCAFLFHQKDKWWTKQQPSTSQIQGEHATEQTL